MQQYKIYRIREHYQSDKIEILIYLRFLYINMGFFDFLISKSSKKPSIQTTNNNLVKTSTPSYDDLMNEGTTLLARGKPTEAIKVFDKILSKTPGDMTAVRWKDLAKIEKRLSSNTIQNKPQDITFPDLQNRNPDTQTFTSPNLQNQNLKTQAVALTSAGNYADAIHLFNQALVISPHDPYTKSWKEYAQKKLDEKQSQRGSSSNPLQNAQKPSKAFPAIQPADMQVHTIGEQPIAHRSFNEKPTLILCTLIKNHNSEVINNKDIFKGLVKDYFKGDFKRESTILIKSVTESVPQDLLAKKDQIPFTILSVQLVQRLDDCGFSKDLSHWAVYAWGKALEIES